MLNTEKVKRIVIKVGTSTLTYEGGKLNISNIERLCRVVCDLKNRGYDVVIVSSGAIGVGVNKLRLEQRPTSVEEKQAVAAVGQSMLMHIYDKLFLEYGHNVAQVLLTRDDVHLPKRKENIINTFNALFKFGTIPIVNENDTVAVDEIVFGDNDTLSAVIANVSSADLLIILSDIDGLYSADPRKDENAKLIPVVTEITDEIQKLAGGAGTANGTGGMITKLHAAEICMENHIPMVIVNGKNIPIVYDILDGNFIGTLFQREEI